MSELLIDKDKELPAYDYYIILEGDIFYRTIGRTEFSVRSFANILFGDSVKTVLTEQEFKEATDYRLPKYQKCKSKEKRLFKNYRPITEEELKKFKGE